jgi:methyl-accepting chemotaxis protein
MNNRNNSKNKQTKPDIEEGGAVFQTPPRRSSPPDEVSPAETFDTALTSPTRTFDDAVDTPPPTKISIDHNVKSTVRSSPRSGAGLIFGMSKPFLGIVAALLLTTSGAAFFLTGWLKIPGLTTQIQELEVQVGRLNAEIGRLSGEVDRLETQNDRYESLNEQLNQTVAEFEILTDELNATVLELEDIADQLNATNQELAQGVIDLAAENENYDRLNGELNTTATQLAAEVDFFEAALTQLILENGMLSNITEVLQNLTDHLGNLTFEQNKTLIELHETLTVFVSENDRLEKLNDGLLTIVTFLNETSQGLDNSLQQVTEFLAGQIAANQVLVLGSLENTYRQRISNWDCDYREIFREETFGSDFSAPITDFASVLDYVDERVLSELCLDVSDFELYLNEANPDGITSFRLIRGVLLYTTEALDYYFPENDETGLTLAGWSQASFTCDNLLNPFFWDTTN